MSAFGQPEVVDPRSLAAGDQVAFADGHQRLRPLTTLEALERVETIWLELCNTPAEPQEHDVRPNSNGEVALNVAGQGWLTAALSSVVAQRAVN